MALLCQCWLAGEQETIDHINRNNPDCGEEFITELFWGYLDGQLKAATKSRVLAHVFKADLLEAYPELQNAHYQVEKIAGTLFMDCERHNKRIEGKTGGDFGLTLIRPSLTESYSHTIQMKKQGMLCQAKLNLNGHKWRGLSRKQKEVLPDKLDFTSLLLYEFSDKKRAQLSPFKWQDCKIGTIDSLSQWLKTGTFPSLITSGEIIYCLASGKTGTSNERLINEIIALKNRPAITIRIDWPDHSKPPSIHQLVLESAPKQHVRILQH